MIPWKALSAHAKGHWRTKAAATKKLRHIACLLCPPRPNLERATLDMRFYMPDKRGRDLLNMSQTMKPAIDGLVDKGLLKDDNWQLMHIGSITAEVDRLHPRVELCVSSRRGNEQA
jgi:hypothetical protein